MAGARDASSNLAEPQVREGSETDRQTGLAGCAGWGSAGSPNTWGTSLSSSRNVGRGGERGGKWAKATARSPYRPIWNPRAPDRVPRLRGLGLPGQFQEAGPGRGGALPASLAPTRGGLPWKPLGPQSRHQRPRREAPAARSPPPRPLPGPGPRPSPSLAAAARIHFRLCPLPSSPARPRPSAPRPGTCPRLLRPPQAILAPLRPVVGVESWAGGVPVLREARRRGRAAGAGEASEAPARARRLRPRGAGPGRAAARCSEAD